MRWFYIFLFLALVSLGIVLGWRLREALPIQASRPKGFSPPPELVPFRTAGGILQTNGFVKSETLHKETGTWLGTTSSTIQLNAIYKFEIVLRDRWNVYVDDTRALAFVVAPAIQPQLPVAVDSKSVCAWTESGWGRFDKWSQLEDLRREISPFLERQARSTGYIEVARGQARQTVEEFVGDWIIKTRGWPEHRGMIKVVFADEPDIRFPEKTGLKDYLP